MLYIHLEKNKIKLLVLKKSILGQYESDFFTKKHEVNFLEGGKVASTDLLASAIKEALTQISLSNNKDVFLILPQEAFLFFKTEVPSDIAPPALKSFIIDKARSTLRIDLDSCFFDYFLKENSNKMQVSFFAIEETVVAKYREALSLLDLRLTNILPETLAIFKLFEKTLRKEKKENIFYVSVEKDDISGYVFDSLGLVSESKWEMQRSQEKSIEDVLKEKATEIESSDTKLNRLILSGADSENVRQDTFTKSVGVWTNPLKRIIPEFYQEYLKLLIVKTQEKVFPILALDLCFGAFVFSEENKEFNILKKGSKSTMSSGIKMPKVSLSLPKKEVAIFIGSFVVSFGLFILLSQTGFDFQNIKLPNLSATIEKSTPTPAAPSATPIPTPEVKKEDLKIKVLNGSGTAGKATQVRQILLDKGYKEVLTGNADNFDYEKTVVQVKKSAEEAVDELKKDLSDNVTNPKVEDLSSDETADVIIIIGSDFK